MRPNRLAQPPDNYFDHEFEEDDYPRRPMSPMRVFLRSHWRWIVSMPLPLRVCVFCGWALILPAALIAGVLIGTAVRGFLFY